MSSVCLKTAISGARFRSCLQSVLNFLAAGLRLSADRTKAASRQLRAFLNRAAAAASRLRPSVRNAAYAQMVDCLRQVEAQTLAVARVIESQEKRLQAFVDIAGTAHKLGRDTRPALTAALEVLEDGRYWMRKQNRLFLATRQACVLAKLANASGQHALAAAAYLKAQQCNQLVVDTDRRIGLAIALADVAAHLKMSFDQAAWLTAAMELASGIRDPQERIGAVNFVARNMVRSQVPPTDDAVADRRFAIDGEAPKQRPQMFLVEHGASASGAVAMTAPDEDLQFNIVG